MSIPETASIKSYGTSTFNSYGTSTSTSTSTSAPNPILHACVKPGVDYRDISEMVRTFDLFMFRGADFISGTIARVEEVYVGVNDFTHVGCAIRACDMNPSSYLWSSRPEVLYIFESTASGPLSDGVPAVTDGKGHLACQMRDMARVVKHYDANPSTRMAWMPLSEASRSVLPSGPGELSKLIDRILDRYMYTAYNASCVNLSAAASPLARHVRDSKFFRGIRSALCMCLCCGAQPNNWLFCSELCAHIYKDIGIFPDTVVPADVMPVDFLPAETTPYLASSDTEESSPSTHTQKGGNSSKTNSTSGKTVDADNQVPWVFRTLVRFHANPETKINTSEDLIEHPESSPL